MSAVATGLCLDCNYSLQGLPTQRCPECGRTFDPTDRSTFNPGRSIPASAAWLVGPISRPIELLAAIAVGVTLWRARLPGEAFGWKAGVNLGWIALASLWLIWPLVRWSVLRHFDWPSSVIKPMPRRHWLIPAVLAIMVALTSLHLPKKWAFLISQPQMDELAATVLAQPRAKHDNQQVGLFTAKNIRAIPGGMKFTAQDDDLHFKAGFVYLPQVNPKHVAWKSYRYIGAGWWTWREEG